MPVACGYVYAGTLFLGAGELVMPPGSSRHICRRKREGTEPKLCQHLDVSFAQASSCSAWCVARTDSLGG